MEMPSGWASRRSRPTDTKGRRQIETEVVKWTMASGSRRELDRTSGEDVQTQSWNKSEKSQKPNKRVSPKQTVEMEKCSNHSASSGDEKRERQRQR